MSVPKHRTINEVYDSCLADGLLRNLDEVNKERVRSLMQNADVYIESAKALADLLLKNDRR